MKIASILIFLLFNLTFAKEQQRFIPANGGGGGSSASNKERLNLINHPKVKTFVKECEESKSEDVANCVWDKTNLPENQDLKTFIENEMQVKKSGKKIDKFDSLSIYERDRKKNKVLEGMENFFEEKLKKALHGIEFKNGKESKATTYVTHNIYYQLAKSQISKSIILAISSYCIEADSENGFRVVNDEDYRKFVKNNNLDKLQTFEVDNKTQEKTISSYQDWALCYRVLPKICYAPEKISADLASKLKNGEEKMYSQESWTPSKDSRYTGIIDSDPDEDEITADKTLEDKLTHLKYTRIRACEVVNYMEKARQDLRSLTGIEDRITQLDKDTAPNLSITINQGRGEKALKLYDSEAKDKGIDDVLITTSKDFHKVHGEGVKKELKEFEKCGNVENGIFTGKDKKACERYLSKNKKEADEHLVNATLKSKTHGEYIKKTIKEKDGVKKVLEDQGYTEDEIKKILSQSEDDIRKQIERRYEKKNQSIIESLKLKENARSRKDKKEVNFASTPDDKNEDTGKLKKIQEKLKASTDTFTQLVHFNNIVSGYLGIEDPSTKKTSKNINSIKRELAGMAQKVIDPDKAKLVSEAIEKSEILNEENSSGREGVAAEMDIKNINTLLEYEKSQTP